MVGLVVVFVDSVVFAMLSEFVESPLGVWRLGRDNHLSEPASATPPDHFVQIPDETSAGRLGRTIRLVAASRLLRKSFYNRKLKFLPGKGTFRKGKSVVRICVSKFHSFELHRSHSKMERTLVLLKPDCVQRRLMGQIIARFEAKGLNMIAAKMLRVTPELAKKHYAEHVEKPFYPGLEAFITGAPIMAMVLEGLDVIRVVRDMLGKTNGLEAAAGTIRGDFSSSRQMNLVHASDGPDAASREINLYFNSDEICEYEPTLTPWMKASDE